MIPREHRAVFLDRDGVLNRAIVRDGRPYPPETLDDFELLPGVAEGVARLKAAGFLLVVVTNQPDVATGKQSRDVVDSMHRHLLERLPLDDIRCCMEIDSASSECYKPKPGMLLAAADELSINLAESYMIGDRWRDVGAGQAAGCHAVFVDRGYRERRPEAPCAIVPDTTTAIDHVLRDHQRKTMMATIDDLNVKIFADGADLGDILKFLPKSYIQGFTTNPTLMRKAGVRDYRTFAREVLRHITDRPVSFEVFADDFPAMERQALDIASWGDNVNVKIPITDTLGDSAAPLVGRLARQGVTVNVTAIFTLDQVRAIADALPREAPAILSVFAGRIADTGRDPVPTIREAVRIVGDRPNVRILWGSPREVLNVFQADACGCHIITATSHLLDKLESSVGKSLDAFSRETVAMFHRDAVAANYQL